MSSCLLTCWKMVRIYQPYYVQAEMANYRQFPPHSDVSLYLCTFVLGNWYLYSWRFWPLSYVQNSSLNKKKFSNPFSTTAVSLKSYIQLRGFLGIVIKARGKNQQMRQSTVRIQGSVSTYSFEGQFLCFSQFESLTHHSLFMVWAKCVRKKFI